MNDNLIKTNYKDLYFISDINGFRTLKPKIPVRIMKGEDNMIERVSMSPSIEGIMSVLPDTLVSTKLAYIYKNKEPILEQYRPTKELVPDIENGNEVWITEEIEVVLFGIIEFGKVCNDGTNFRDYSVRRKIPVLCSMTRDKIDLLTEDEYKSYQVDKNSNIELLIGTDEQEYDTIVRSVNYSYPTIEYVKDIENVYRLLKSGTISENILPLYMMEKIIDTYGIDSGIGCGFPVHASYIKSVEQYKMCQEHNITIIDSFLLLDSEFNIFGIPFEKIINLNAFTRTDIDIICIICKYDVIEYGPSINRIPNNLLRNLLSDTMSVDLLHILSDENVLSIFEKHVEDLSISDVDFIRIFMIDLELSARIIPYIKITNRQLMLIKTGIPALFENIHPRVKNRILT